MYKKYDARVVVLLNIPIAFLTFRYVAVVVPKAPCYRTNQAYLAPVVQTSDSAIQRINHYLADSVIDFRNT